MAGGYSPGHPPEVFGARRFGLFIVAPVGECLLGHVLVPDGPRAFWRGSSVAVRVALDVQRKICLVLASYQVSWARPVRCQREPASVKFTPLTLP